MQGGDSPRVLLGVGLPWPGDLGPRRPRPPQEKTIHEEAELVLSSADVSDQEGAHGATSSVHEDLAMRILTERLRLLGSQRELAAMHCHHFTQMLEASLAGQAQPATAQGPSKHTDRQQMQGPARRLTHSHTLGTSSASPLFPRSSLSLSHPQVEGAAVTAGADMQGLVPSGPASPSLATASFGPEDDEHYWSSPNFYRGKHRGAYPTPCFGSKALSLGSRMPVDPYFEDPQKERKKLPNRHVRRSRRRCRDARNGIINATQHG